MKIISWFIGIVFLVMLTVVTVNIFFKVGYDSPSYDILISSKNEIPKKHLGIRYKEDLMIHLFEVKTVGDSIGSLIDDWQKNQTEKKAS